MSAPELCVGRASPRQLAGHVLLLPWHLRHHSGRGRCQAARQQGRAVMVPRGHTWEGKHDGEAPLGDERGKQALAPVQQHKHHA